MTWKWIDGQLCRIEVPETMGDVTWKWIDGQLCRIEKMKAECYDDAPAWALKGENLNSKFRRIF